METIPLRDVHYGMEMKAAGNPRKMAIPDPRFVSQRASRTLQPGADVAEISYRRETRFLSSYRSATWIRDSCGPSNPVSPYKYVEVVQVITVSIQIRL